MRIMIGNGGHARSCRDVLGGGQELHYLADGNQDGPDHLGGFADIARFPDALFHLAIGPSRARAELAAALLMRAVHWFPVISAEALVRTEDLGAGVMIGHRAYLGPGSRLGDLSIVNTNALVEHDCRIGTGAFVGPGAILCGNVTVGDYAMIGAGAVVVPDMTIAPHARIPAGAVVR